jgi:gamma-glutamyltranspeptidase
MLAMAVVALAIIAVFLWQRFGSLVPIMLAQDRKRAALPKWTDGTSGIIVATTGGYAVDGVSIPASAQPRVCKIIGPGNRQFATPSPLLFMLDKKSVLACGAIGVGDCKTLQVVENIFDFHMNLPAAEKAPAFLQPLSRYGKLVAQLNRGEFESKVLDGLRNLGIKAEIVHANPQFGYWAGVQIDPESRRLSGAVSRGDSEQVAGC